MSTETLKTLVKQASSWPNEDQLELVDYARVIEARRSGRYSVTAAEHAAIAEGMDQADRGEFVDEAAIAAADKRHGS